MSLVPAVLRCCLADNGYRSGTDEDYQTKFFEPYSRTLARAHLWSAFGNHDGWSSNPKLQVRQSNYY